MPVAGIQRAFGSGVESYLPLLDDLNVLRPNSVASSHTSSFFSVTGMLSRQVSRNCFVCPRFPDSWYSYP